MKINEPKLYTTCYCALLLVAAWAHSALLVVPLVVVGLVLLWGPNRER